MTTNPNSPFNWEGKSSSFVTDKDKHGFNGVNSNKSITSSTRNDATLTVPLILAKNKFSEKNKQAIKDMVASGVSKKATAAHFDISPQTVHKYCR